MNRARHVRTDIQGLRALAVALVVLDHVFAWPQGGYIGVDVFFVISGFVITQLLLREIDRTESISLATFYRRRARRILPAAGLVTLVTVILSAMLLPADRALGVWKDAVWATLFSANWAMAANGTDYFQQGLPPSPLQHYWSLSIEEQFYFIWPAVILLTLLISARVVKRRARGALWIPAAVIVLGGLAWSVVQTAANPNLAYFSSFTRFWELGIGVCLALAAPHLARIPATMRVALAYSGVAAILAAAFALSPSSAFPGALALVPTLGAAAVIVAGVAAPPTHGRWMAPLSNRLAVYVGDRSYSIYLWHFPLTVLVVAVLPPRTLTSLGVIAATLVLSELTYRLLEDPIRRSNWLEPGAGRAPSAGARRALVTITALITVLVVVGTTLSSAAPADSSTKPAVAANAGCLGAGTLVKHGCAPISGMRPDPGRLQNDTAGAFSSDCYRSRDAAPKSCSFGSTRSDATEVALIGDSHAGMYLAILRRIAPAMNWHVTTYIGWGCSWGPHPGQPCAQQTAKAQADFSDDTPYDLIITAASRQAVSTWKQKQYAEAAGMWRAAIAAGSRVIAMQSVPIPSEDAMLCVQRVTFHPPKDRCDTSLPVALEAPDAIEHIAHLAGAGATVVKTRDLVCAPATCSSVTGGVIVFRDSAGHLTGSYLQTMTPYIRQRLESAWKGLSTGTP